MVRGGDVFFMLKVKCPVIAGDIGSAVGALVLRGKGHSVAVGFWPPNMGEKA